jgi:hypothetical protein
VEIQFLLDSTNYRFLKFLRTTDENGLKFTGSVHCEASLASLLQYYKSGTTDDTCKDIRAQLNLGYAFLNPFP